MRVSAEGHAYEWHEPWCEPTVGTSATAWAHHDIVVNADGSIVSITPDSSRVLVFSPDGLLQRSFECDLLEGHGMTLSVEDGREFLWIADCGLKLFPDSSVENGEGMTRPPGAGRVIKVDLSAGEIVQQLPTPNHVRYDECLPYSPTAVTMAPNGEIWVADGYGASLLHRYTSDGDLIATLSGEESAAGTLREPHGLLVDTRGDQPLLYVADRRNTRLLVLDLDGSYVRSVTSDAFLMPSALATHGDMLVVGDLNARLTLLDGNDDLIGILGDNQAALERPGWPNVMTEDGLQPPDLVPGLFNSPHGLATDARGSILVTEFVLGGRGVKLESLT